MWERPGSESCISHVPLSTDLRGPCQLLQRGRLLTLGGLCLPLAVPHPGHPTLPVVQRGPVHSQSSRQVRGGSSKDTGQAAHEVAPGLAPVTMTTTAVWSKTCFPIDLGLTEGGHSWPEGLSPVWLPSTPF